jgi:hypothetical protein
LLVLRKLLYFQSAADGLGGALGACPRFDLNANGNHLTVGGTRYGHGYDAYATGYVGHCPQGARVAAGATISWDTDGACSPGGHRYGDGYEICF